MALWSKNSLINRRASVAFIHDLIMAALSFWVSMALRLGFDSSAIQEIAMVPATLMFVGTAGAVFLSLRLYRGIWRYASMSDLVSLAKAVSILILLFTVEMFFLLRLEGLPRSVPLINWFVLMAMLGGPRFIYRLIRDRGLQWSIPTYNASLIPVLLVGAGDEAELFIRATRRGANGRYRAVAILSEQRGRVGQLIHNVPVRGLVSDIKTVVASLPIEDRPQRLVLTKPNIEGPAVREWLETAASLGMTLARLPDVQDLNAGTDSEIKIQPVALEDLLGRPQQPLDRDAMTQLVQGKRVLITGAGGSIGSELVRQVAAIGPEALVLVENSEFALYQIDRELAEQFPDLPRHAIIADVRHRARIDQVFAKLKPELVFHAAALKHVPLVEDNPFEGILTNAMGTQNIADACEAAGVGVMVMISTDKAVNPTNIMGTTKRIAESYVQALDLRRDTAQNSTGTRFVTVRFGNVLGSTGSVVPLFQRQLAAGGPITVTHPDMTRYFMTIREAVELVLQASSLGINKPAQSGKIFVLDMGEPMKIVELAEQMIRLAGQKPYDDIPIEFTGTRPGEKLFEEIFHGKEPPVPTTAPGVLLASPRTQNFDTVALIFTQLKSAALDEDLKSLMTEIAKLVPEYAPPA